MADPTEVICDPNSMFFGMMGISAAMVFANLGSAYGTAKIGVGVCSMGVMRPDLLTRSVIPVVLAGVLGIYGLIMGIVIQQGIGEVVQYSAFLGYSHLAAGLMCGLSALAAGFAIGIVGDAGVRANAQQPKVYFTMILILIASEALAVYGLILGILIGTAKPNNLCTAFAPLPMK